MKHLSPRALLVVLCFISMPALWYCSGKKTVESQVGATEDLYYTPEDFARVDKFDSHIHLNTEQTAFIENAAKDNVKFLVIVDDRPFGITMDEQERIIRSQLKHHHGQIAYATTFSVNDFHDPDWLQATLAHLDDAFAHGAIAVKVWKNIGMDLRDPDGTFVMIDDERFDPVLNYLAAKGIPLIGHLGEPRDCWLPLEEMTFHQGYYRAHPEYHMYLHPEYPSYDDQINARDQMLARHPDLKFIGAHLGSLEWSLDELARRLDKFPNMAVDLARMSNLKYHAMVDWHKTREFFIKYQDRLLYATDVQVRATDDPAGMNQRTHAERTDHWRFFTTDDPFTIAGIEGTGNGLKLPRSVIDKIYRKNAEAWLPGIPG